LFFIFQIILEKRIQVKAQNNIHHNAIDKNEIVQCINSHVLIVVHSKIIHNTTKNKANAVQSLNKLSHSNINANLLGAPILLKIDNTATGSVAEINVQNNKQTKKGISKFIIGKIKYNPIQINIDDIINQKTANELIIFQFFNNSLYLIL
jgi:hypothetical protein